MSLGLGVWGLGFGGWGLGSGVWGWVARDGGEVSDEVGGGIGCGDEGAGVD